MVLTSILLTLLTSDVLDPNACSCRTSAHSLVPTLDPSDPQPFPPGNVDLRVTLWINEKVICQIVRICKQLHARLSEICVASNCHCWHWYFFSLCRNIWFISWVFNVTSQNQVIILRSTVLNQVIFIYFCFLFSAVLVLGLAWSHSKCQMGRPSCQRMFRITV